MYLYTVFLLLVRFLIIQKLYDVLLGTLPLFI